MKNDILYNLLFGISIGKFTRLFAFVKNKPELIMRNNSKINEVYKSIMTNIKIRIKIQMNIHLVLPRRCQLELRSLGDFKGAWPIQIDGGRVSSISHNFLKYNNSLSLFEGFEPINVAGDLRVTLNMATMVLLLI